MDESRRRKAYHRAVLWSRRKRMWGREKCKEGGIPEMFGNRSRHRFTVKLVKCKLRPFPGPGRERGHSPVFMWSYVFVEFAKTILTVIS